MINGTYADVHGIELGGAQIVHNLIRSEESKRIGEVLEVLDDTKDAREVARIVARPWRRAVDALASQGRIDVEDHVDAGRVEDGGAFRVVELGVDVVDADRVDLDMLVSNCQRYA